MKSVVQFFKDRLRMIRLIVMVLHLMGIADGLQNMLRAKRFDKSYIDEWTPKLLYILERKTEIHCSLICLADKLCPAFFYSKSQAICGWTSENSVTSKTGYLTAKDTKFYCSSASDHWKILVFTSNLPVSSSDADVYLTVYDVTGSAIYTPLLDDVYRDDFERGNIDSFEFELSCIIEPYKLEIWSPDTLGASAWHLNKVELIGPTKKVYTFHCDCWANLLGQLTFCFEIYLEGLTDPPSSIWNKCDLDGSMIYHHNTINA